jgi:hypothetical protein
MSKILIEDFAQALQACFVAASLQVRVTIAPPASSASLHITAAPHCDRSTLLVQADSLEFYHDGFPCCVSHVVEGSHNSEPFEAMDACTASPSTGEEWWADMRAPSSRFMGVPNPL